MGTVALRSSSGCSYPILSAGAPTATLAVMTSEAGKHIGLAAEAQVISCSASRCITARERKRALQVRVHAGVDGSRLGSFVVLYRTTQPDIAVQER